MDNQLPVEVQQKIHADTNQLYDQLDSAARGVDSYDYGLPQFDRQTEPIRNLLTEYAKKLHQERQYNEHLKIGFDLYKDEMAERRQVNIDAIKLLKKFISRHEAGLLPDRFIYQEIKNFLDGTK